MCVCVCVHECVFHVGVQVCVYHGVYGRLKDNLKEFILSSQHAGSRDWTQVIGPSSKRLYLQPPGLILNLLYPSERF